MTREISSDPRHRLHWYRLNLPNGGYLAANPFDGAKAKVGLGVEQGVQHYRDSLGRIHQVASKWFADHATRVHGSEAQALWLPLEADYALKRFPGLEKWAAAEQEKAWVKRQQEKELALRQKQKSLKRGLAKGGKSSQSRGSASTVVEVMVKKPRRPGVASPGGPASS